MYDIYQRHMLLEMMVKQKRMGGVDNTNRSEQASIMSGTGPDLYGFENAASDKCSGVTIETKAVR